MFCPDGLQEVPGYVCLFWQRLCVWESNRLGHVTGLPCYWSIPVFIWNERPSPRVACCEDRGIRGHLSAEGDKASLLDTLHSKHLSPYCSRV